MCNNFKEIREQLDELGYFQTVHPESIPLVQKLLLDLNQTTANLQKYMKISQQALEEKNLLELGAEPYKCDNAKLLRECNELHQAFIHFKEQHEKVQRDLRHQISNLQAQLENCNFEKLKLINSIQNYEKEKVKKGTSKTANKTKTSITRDSIQTNSNKKIKDLELKHLKLMDDNEYLKTQIKRRDEEIKRLQSLTEKGRSYETISKECCYKNIDIQMMSLQEEITRLKGEKTEMQLQLNDAVAKQHEAMRRALHLAERNRQLEQELKEVDEVALAVEAECNNTVKGNSEKVARLQDRINESLIIIQELEIENAKLKQTKLELTADLQAIELEKCNLRKELDKEKNDKKNLTDRINSFTVIENDLNLEIDRLTKLVANQRKRILELESLNSDEKSRAYLSNSNRENVESLQHMVNTGKSGSIQKVSSTRGSSSSKVKTSHKNLCKKSKNKTTTKNESATVEEETVQKPVNPEFITKCCCESGNCIKNLKDLLDREAELRKEHARQSIDDLRREKDYYMKEYHRILEQMRNVPNYEISENGLAQLKLQLNEKNNRIKRLEEELQYLNNEKSSLHVGDLHTQVPCNKMSCKSRDRELEIKTKELNHLEAENNTLKGKLQAFNETTIFNEERMKKAFKDMEEHIRKLEDERRDLVKTEVTQRSNISQLEDEYKNIKDQLKRTQIELNSQRANYNQLKLLHEQTDRALGEAQTQLLHAENELGSYKSRAKDSSRDTFIQDKEITKLSSDIQIMKNQLTKLDKEKDDLINKLDEKTERIAELEDALHTKDNLITKLENDLRDVNRKLSKYVNESSSQEHLARTKQQELTVLEQDYEKEKRLKEAALLENKRLQNDLSSVTYDCREARKELEITRRQVEDLKRQLQHYVAEVKRTEDLISQKELERSELLDQFRSLSQEANILETNNHTLETEATQSKIQLSVALDHTSELERKIENQESIIKSYEKQITDLTAHIARLEVQLKQNTLEQERCNAELKQMRDLCVKLDKDKDVLKSELNCNEDIRSQEQRLTQRLSEEKTSLQKILDHERSSRESLEKLLKDARVDLTEQRLLNQDLQREVNILKDKIEDLEERLTTTTEQLHTYEGKVLEYSQQNKQLRREIANERFSKSKSDDKGKRSQNENPTKEYSAQSKKNLTKKFNDTERMYPNQHNLSKLSQITEPVELSANPETYHQSLSSTRNFVFEKTLVPSSGVQGSEGFLASSIDLTRLDEKCNENSLYSQSNKAKINEEKCQKTMTEEIFKTTEDLISKSLNFASSKKANHAENSENDKINLETTYVPRGSRDSTRRSIISTKSLSITENQQIRAKAKGLTNLQELSDKDNEINISPDTRQLAQSLLYKDTESFDKDIINQSKCVWNSLQLDSVERNSEKEINLSFTQLDKNGSSNDKNTESKKDIPIRLSNDNNKWVEYQKLSISNSESDIQKRRVSKEGDCFTKSKRDTETFSKDNKCPLENPSSNEKTPWTTRSTRIPDSRNESMTNIYKERLNKTELLTPLTSHTQDCEVYATFGSSSNNSAVFRKVFSVDGVGLECQCCISSFKVSK